MALLFASCFLRLVLSRSRLFASALRRVGPFGVASLSCAVLGCPWHSTPLPPPLRISEIFHQTCDSETA
jgi:hypothetical protein